MSPATEDGHVEVRARRLHDSTRTPINFWLLAHHHHHHLITTHTFVEKRTQHAYTPHIISQYPSQTFASGKAVKEPC